MRDSALALALAGTLLAPALAAKPAPRKVAPPAKAPVKTQAKPAVQDGALEPDVQFRPANKTAPAKPATKAAPAVTTAVASPKTSVASLPGLPVSTLPTEEAAQYEQEITQQSAAIDKILTRLDKSGKHKATGTAQGVKALASQRERMASILKDEKVGKDDREALDGLVKQQGLSTYMYSSSLLLLNRNDQALDYLREMLKSVPESSHLRHAALMQIRSMNATP
ncbi:MAG TPA: hypothetical protein VGN26_19105 [Armatimonadota bacterium]